MDPIQEFRAALWLFKKVSKEVVPLDERCHRKMAAVKRFKNLAEFTEYNNSLYKRWYAKRYKKKTDVVYKKRNITAKITIDRKEDPKGWMKQYKWFQGNPDAEVYAPKRARGGGKKRPKSELSKKIKVSYSENPREYWKQYAWFKLHPDAEVYDGERHCYSEISKKINVSRKVDRKEYDRQYSWFKNNPDADVCPPRSFTRTPC